MSDQQIDVRIRAQTSDLKQGMEGAARDTERAASRMRQAMSDAADQMRQAAAKVQDQFKGLGDGAKTQMGGVADSVRGEVAAMGGHFSGLFEALSKTKAGFIALGAVVAAIAFKKAIDETAQITEKAMDLGRALGMTASQAQIYRLALEDIGAEQGEFEGAAKGLARQLRENEEEMNKIGLVTRDASGELRPLNELVMDGISVLNGYKEGTDRALASQQIFGRGIDASSKLLLLNKETIEETAKAAEELGLEVGANSVAAWKEFDAASDRAGFSIKGVVKAIGDQLMPVATDLINAFNAVMPAAITVLRGALGGLAAAFHAVKNGIVVVWETINALVVTVAEPIRALAEAIYRAMTGDFQGAAAAIKGIGGNITSAWDSAMTNIGDSSQKTADRIVALFSRDAQPGEAGGQAGAKGYTPPKEKKSKDGAEKSRVGEWETQLAEMKVAFQEAANTEGTFRQFSKDQELAFWREKQALTQQGSNENLSIRKKVAELQQGINKDAFDTEMAMLRRQQEEAGNNAQRKLAIAEREVAEVARVYGMASKEYEKAEQRRVQIAKQASDQIDQLRTIENEKRRAQALAQIDAQADAAKLDLQLGNLTKQQMLVLEEQFEQRRTEIKRQALADRLALIDPDTDPVKFAELKAKIEELELQHQQRMREIKRQMTVEQAGPEMNVFKSMESSFEEAITGMITRAQTLQQALSNIFKSVFTVFVQEMVSKPLAMAAARVIRESALYQALAGTQVATQGAASGAVVGMKAAETTGVVSANAAQAASGAAASQASIPYVGPALAMAAAAAMMAFVMGMGNKGGSTTTTTTRIPSASKGFDIPAGVNPLTQLHEKEMVLPAEQAQAIRDMTGGGGAAQAVHLHVTAMDSRDVKRFLMDNRGAVADALKGALRDFKR